MEGSLAVSRSRSATMDELARTLFAPLFSKPWPIWAGALAFAVANVLMAAYARGLGVFPQISMWGASLYNLVGIKTEAPFPPYPVTPVYLDVHSMINFGIILGVLIAALLSREFKLRTDTMAGYGQGFLGGILMGFGTVMTPPCNVGGFGTAIMALSLSGYLMALGLLMGGYVGGRVLIWQASRAVATLQLGDAPRVALPVEKTASHRQIWGWMALVVLVAVAAAYLWAGRPNFAVLLMFGAIFGVIFQRSRLCFASAFRDVFLTGETLVLRWILVSLVVGMLGFSILKANGFVAADHFVFPAGLHTVVGGFLFGIGMVLAGGCGSGILWRSAEGYVRHWFALLGGMLAAGSWVHIYGNQVGKGWLYGPKVFLPDALGWGGALAASVAVIVISYLLLTWWEVRRK